MGINLNAEHLRLTVRHTSRVVVVARKKSKLNLCGTNSIVWPLSGVKIKIIHPLDSTDTTKYCLASRQDHVVFTETCQSH